MTARNKRWHKDHAEEMKPRFNAASRRMRQTDPLRCLLYQAKARAKKKGCEFDLDIAKMLMPERCPILGIKLESSMGTGTGRFRDCSPSIDRIDNSLGYTQDNVVIISWRANRLKGDASLDELRKIADFYSERATAAA